MEALALTSFQFPDTLNYLSLANAPIAEVIEPDGPVTIGVPSITPDTLPYDPVTPSGDTESDDATYYSPTDPQQPPLDSPAADSTTTPVNP